MDKQEPLPYWVDVQVDLSLCWSHRSYCRFCHVLTHFSCLSLKSYVMSTHLNSLTEVLLVSTCLFVFVYLCLC